MTRLTKAAFPSLQQVGLHVVHNDFYSPVPDTSKLPDSLWTTPSELVGVDMNEAAQTALLDGLAARYRDEYKLFPLSRTSDQEYFINNGFFESVDSEMYYCMIREHRPRRVVEIGAGHSTLLAARAIARNHMDDMSYGCELVAIEPYPRAMLLAGFPGLTHLAKRPVQDLEPDWFKRLESGDILLIDSSHVLKMGSDVWFEYLEVIPRLNPGVLVHAHDIFLPAHYRKQTVVRDKWFWNEQYVLQAFLAFNSCFEVLWSSSWMHLHHPQRLMAAFPSYDPAARWPGSLWFRRTGDSPRALSG